MTFTFNNAIPAAGNNPSSDQPDMLTNNISNALIWDVDHYGFNNANGGLHKQVRIPTLASIPSGLIASEGTLYTKTANGASQLFYTNGNSGNEYQITRVNDVNFPSFGTLNAYGASPVPRPANQTWRGGWTFLTGNGGNVGLGIPANGGLILQYGFVVRDTFLPPLVQTQGSTDFPRPFSSTCFTVITTTLYNTPAPSASAEVSIRNNNSSTPSTTQFDWTLNTNSNQIIGFNWIAIGI